MLSGTFPQEYNVQASTVPCLSPDALSVTTGVTSKSYTLWSWEVKDESQVQHVLCHLLTPNGLAGHPDWPKLVRLLKQEVLPSPCPFISTSSACVSTR